MLGLMRTDKLFVVKMNIAQATQALYLLIIFHYFSLIIDVDVNRNSGDHASGCFHLQNRVSPVDQCQVKSDKVPQKSNKSAPRKSNKTIHQTHQQPSRRNSTGSVRASWDSELPRSGVEEVAPITVVTSYSLDLPPKLPKKSGKTTKTASVTTGKASSHVEDKPGMNSHSAAIKLQTTAVGGHQRGYSGSVVPSSATTTTTDWPVAPARHHKPRAPQPGAAQAAALTQQPQYQTTMQAHHTPTVPPQIPPHTLNVSTSVSTHRVFRITYNLYVFTSFTI